MTRQPKTSLFICLIHVLVAIPALGQSRSHDASPTLTTYRLPESLDGKTTEAVLDTLLSGSPNVKLTLDISQKHLVALGNETDHRVIADAMEILRNPVRIDSDAFVSLPHKSERFLRVYALDESVKSIAKSIAETILEDHKGARLSVDSKSGNLIVFAVGQAHDLIAESLGELMRSTPGGNSKPEPDGTSRNKFAIHSFENQPLLLNSQTGETCILRKADDSKIPAWIRITRDH